MIGLFNLKRAVLASETSISDYVPYSHHVTDTIISTKNAEYLSVWKLSGRSHQSASLEDVYSWVRDLNNTLRGIATANIVFIRISSAARSVSIRTRNLIMLSAKP